MPLNTCRRRYPLTGLLLVILATLAAILFFAGWTLIAAIVAGLMGVLLLLVLIRWAMRPQPPTASSFTCSNDGDQP
jgi:glucose uptake protein GlcU